MSRNLTNTYKERKQEWGDLKTTLLANNNCDNNWEDAFNIYKKRLESRYFNPIDELLKAKNGYSYKNFEGWGFSIMVILSSLIEQLSSIAYGKIEVKHFKDHPFPDEYIYNNKKDRNKFNSFFSFFSPFNKNHKLYSSFFKDIRSLLFHDARISSKWQIKTRGSKVIDEFVNGTKIDLSKFPPIDGNIIYRESFYSAIKFDLMDDLKIKVINNTNNHKINLRHSLARKLDIIYSQYDSFNDIDFSAIWWESNMKKKEKKISNLFSVISHLFLKPFNLKP